MKPRAVHAEGNNFLLVLLVCFFFLLLLPVYLPVSHLRCGDMSNSNKSKKDKEILAEYESHVKGKLISRHV